MNQRAGFYEECPGLPGKYAFFDVKVQTEGMQDAASGFIKLTLANAQRPSKIKGN